MRRPFGHHGEHIVTSSGPLGAGTGLAGLASGAFIVGALLGRLVIGEGVERIGLKKVLTIGFTVSLIGIVANLVLPGFIPLVISRII